MYKYYFATYFLTMLKLDGNHNALDSFIGKYFLTPRILLFILLALIYIILYIVCYREEKKNEPEEALSPSQSESSRATRWEALADIAAELPPSLTVDPITGQIYSLAK